MAIYNLQEMTWPEVREALTEAKVAILPTGSQEQHGPHLCCSADIAGAVAFAQRVAEAVHPLTLVAPPLNFGISTHHMAFPGTITLQPETFEQVLMDIASSLRHHGLRRLFVINGHGGNQHALDLASVKMRRDLGVRMAYTLWPVLGGGAAADVARGRRIGHACVFETSMLMHLRRDLVREDALVEGELESPLYGDLDITGIGGFAYWNEYTRNGALQGAPEAKAEIGERLAAEALGRIIPVIRRLAELPVEEEPGLPHLASR